MTRKEKETNDSLLPEGGLGPERNSKSERKKKKKSNKKLLVDYFSDELDSEYEEILSKRKKKKKKTKSKKPLNELESDSEQEVLSKKQKKKEKEKRSKKSQEKDNRQRKTKAHNSKAPKEESEDENEDHFSDEETSALIEKGKQEKQALKIEVDTSNQTNNLIGRAHDEESDRSQNVTKRVALACPLLPATGPQTHVLPRRQATSGIVAPGPPAKPINVQQLKQRKIRATTKKGCFASQNRCIQCIIVSAILFLISGASLAVILYFLEYYTFWFEQNGSKDDGSLSLSGTAGVGSTPKGSAFPTKSLPTSTWNVIRNENSSPQARAYQWLKSDPFISKYTDAQKLQRFVLASLYYATNGEKWKDSTAWLSTSTPECEWSSKADTDSICDSEGNYRVLSISSNGLEGFLPEEIGLLTALRELNVQSNRGLSGPLPSTIGFLTTLESINIYDNDLTGSIPSEIGLLENLVELNVEFNRFSAEIPSEVGQLQYLETMSLSYNRFGGTLPSELGLLKSLKELIMEDGGLEGTIPTEIGSLRQVREVGVHHLLDIFAVYLTADGFLVFHSCIN